MENKNDYRLVEYGEEILLGDEQLPIKPSRDGLDRWSWCTQLLHLKVGEIGTRHLAFRRKWKD